MKFYISISIYKISGWADHRTQTYIYLNWCELSKHRLSLCNGANARKNNAPRNWFGEKFEMRPIANPRTQKTRQNTAHHCERTRNNKLIIPGEESDPKWQLIQWHKTFCCSHSMTSRFLLHDYFRPSAWAFDICNDFDTLFVISSDFHCPHRPKIPQNQDND